MAGLNANVTLGSGVAPIPSQINVPPASDEMSFGDAFAEAQASRQADARGAVQDPSWRPGPARPVSLTASADGFSKPKIAAHSMRRPAAAQAGHIQGETPAPFGAPAFAIQGEPSQGGSNPASSADTASDSAGGAVGAVDGVGSVSAPAVRVSAPNQSAGATAPTSAETATNQASAPVAPASEPAPLQDSTMLPTTPPGSSPAATGGLQGDASIGIPAVSPSSAGPELRSGANSATDGRSVARSRASLTPPGPTAALPSVADSDVSLPAQAVPSGGVGASSTEARTTTASSWSTAAGAPAPAVSSSVPLSARDQVARLGAAATEVTTAPTPTPAPTVSTAMPAGVGASRVSTAPDATQVVAADSGAAQPGLKAPAPETVADSKTVGSAATSSPGAGPVAAAAPMAHGRAAGASSGQAYPNTTLDQTVAPASYAGTDARTDVGPKPDASAAAAASASPRSSALDGPSVPARPAATQPAPLAAYDSPAPALPATQDQAAQPAVPAIQVAASVPEAAVAGAVRIVSRGVGKGNSSSLLTRVAATDTGIVPNAATLDRVGALQGAATSASATDKGAGSGSGDASSRPGDLAAAPTPAAISANDSASSFATSAGSVAAAIGAQGAAAPRPTSSEAVTVAGGPSMLAESAEKLMGQVVQTIRTFQTSDGPRVEARVSDPTLGEVTLIVTGRAGEVVQAQLFARDRASADALSQAAFRINSTGNALAGVSVTVRSESGGGATTGGRAGNSFEAGGWTSTAGNGAGNGQSGRGDHGDGVGSQNTGGAGSGPGNGAGPDLGTGRQSSDTAHSGPVLRPVGTRVTNSMPRSPLPGGSSVDIRA